MVLNFETRELPLLLCCRPNSVRSTVISPHAYSLFYYAIGKLANQREIYAYIIFICSPHPGLFFLNFSRLPIIQGSTFSYLVPTFAILSLPKFQCPPGFRGKFD